MTIHLPAESALALAVALTDVRFDLAAKRSAAEKAIEDLIQFLDDIEGDCDLEASTGFDTEGDVLDDGEAVDEDGGDVLDEPHDVIDEGNDEESDELGAWVGMTAEAKAAVKDECAALLDRLPRRQGPEFQAWFAGPSGVFYRFHKAS